MKLPTHAIKHSCLSSLLVVGMAVPLVGCGQDDTAQQTPSASNQNQQAQTTNNQNQQTGAQGNQNQQANSQANQNQANSQGNSNQQVDLTNYTNGSFVTLRGTVESVAPNTFTLTYNNNETVTVEMDDGDADADAYALLPGDKVTVTGLLDRDLFESRTIEAGSVYVEKLNTYFMSSALDEEDYPMFATIVAVEVPSGSDSSQSSSGSSSQSSASPSSSSTAGQSTASENMPVLWLQGRVSSISDNSIKLALGEGNNEITVSTENLASNPLDDQGDRKIEQGDIVQVSGTIDGGFFDTQELAANSIAKIHDAEAVNDAG